MKDEKNNDYVSRVNREQILAPQEIKIGHPLACDHYTPHTHDFLLLYGVFQFELSDMALFHRSAISTAKSLDKELEEYITSIKNRPETPNYNDEDPYFWTELKKSREREYIIENDSRINSIAINADELLIVGLWSKAEKYLNKSLSILSTTSHDHRFNQIIISFNNHGIDITKLPGYEGANECRLINNSIKHGGLVSQQLSNCVNFTNKEGIEINSIHLNVQQYMLSIHHFIGSLLETCSQGSEPHVQLSPWMTDSFGRSLQS